METTEQIVDVQTPDGVMAVPTYRPTEGGPHPAIIVIMEAFGVNSNITGLAQRFAAEGYVAAAPDLFHRSGRLRFAPYDKLQEMREELRVGFGDASIDAGRAGDDRQPAQRSQRERGHRHRGLLPRRTRVDAVGGPRERPLGGGHLLRRLHAS